MTKKISAVEFTNEEADEIFSIQEQSGLSWNRFILESARALRGSMELSDAISKNKR